MAEPSTSSAGKSARIPRRPQTKGMLALVLVNGLLLSGAVFILLHFFVGNLLGAARQSNADELSAMIESGARRVSETMAGIAGVLETQTSQPDMSGLFLQVRKGGREFPFLYMFWVPAASGAGIGTEQVYPPYEGDIKVKAEIEQAVRGYFEKNAPLRPEIQTAMVPVRVSFPITEEVVKFKDQDYRIKSDYAVLLYSTSSYRQMPGYLVGVVPGKRLLDFSRLSKASFIEHFLASSKDGGRLVEINQSGSTYAGSSSHDMTSIIDLESWGVQVRLEFVPNKRTDVYMLSILPWVAFAMMLFLTAMGSLYVKDNQKQAAVLTKMNRTLALKNMEMNSQVIERERLNQTLRRNERENRSIINSVSDIIFELDGDARFVFTNEKWQKILGYTDEEAREKIIFDLMEESARAEQRDLFERKLIADREGYDFSVRMMRADDTYRLMDVRFSMIRADEGGNVRIVGSMSDAEERRRAQLALIEAEKKYRTIWENAASGIYQATIDGKLLSANPALARIFGYAGPEEILHDVDNMNRQMFLNQKERQIFVRDLLARGSVTNVESQGRRRDRKTFWISETVRVVRNEDGEILYLEGSIEDINERKEAELKLKESMMQTQLASRSKTEFLSNMSHELRTPLNAIIGFSEIIKDEVLGKIKQRQYLEYARDIYESGKNLLTIINTILDVARIEAGERQLNEARIVIPKVVQSVIDIVKVKLDASKQQITVKLPEFLPGLYGEELAVKQILVNLLSNAIKFTPESGLITITAELDKGGDLRLSVTDTGVGLDPDEIERVTSMFGQTSGSFARTSSGSGLGLTLVNALMRLHGGRFELISQKSIGTTATVIFPSTRLEY